MTVRTSRELDVGLKLYQVSASEYIPYVEIDSGRVTVDLEEKPSTFKNRSWMKWEESVYPYLDSIFGKCGAYEKVGANDVFRGLPWA